MFLSTFESLQSSTLSQHVIASIVHLGGWALNSIGGEVVSITAFVLETGRDPDYMAGSVCLVVGNSVGLKAAMFNEAIA